MRVTPLALVAVATGGAVGAVARWGMDAALSTGSFPWTILVINVTGAFALGALPLLALVRRSHLVALALGPGLLGGFTTVSTWTLQVHDLSADGRTSAAGIHLGLTLVAGLLAADLGRRLARRPEPADALT